jgi:hypothetical protein
MCTQERLGSIYLKMFITQSMTTLLLASTFRVLKEAFPLLLISSNKLLFLQQTPKEEMKELMIE